MANKLSVIVPVYNEENTITTVLEQIADLDLTPLNWGKEIIVIDDGSTDGTREILSKLNFTESVFKLISHKKNQGKGAAIKTGLKEATGEVIAIQDADLEYNPQELKKLLRALIENNIEVVYGSRFLQNNPTIYKRYAWGNKILSLLISFLYWVMITDAYTCYKMFKKGVVDNLNLESKGFEFEAEITCKLLKRRRNIFEVPISYQPRSLEAGKKISWRDAFLGIWTVFKNRFSLTDSI